MDQANKSFVRVGSILELRRSRRSMNRVGLTKLAQSLFATLPGDIICVGADTVVDQPDVAGGRLSILNAG